MNTAFPHNTTMDSYVAPWLKNALPEAVWLFLDKHGIALVGATTFLLTVAFFLYNKWRAERHEYTALSDSDLKLDDLFASRSDMPCGGSTDTYDWSQTDEEVDVYVKVPPETRAKDVECTITSKKLKVVAQGEVIVDGELYNQVQADDSTWQIDGKGDKTRVWITLFKKVKTEKKHHWRAVIKGDPEIDTEHLGPPVRTIDASDPNSMRDAAHMLREIQQH